MVEIKKQALRKKLKVRLLEIIINGERVASLTKKANGAIEMQYDDYWLNNYPDFPISRQMPVREDPYKGEVVSFYFENLLPDSKEVREKLAAKTRAHSASTFDLLAALGKDCIGALQLIPHGMEPPPVGVLQGLNVSESDIAQTLRNLYSQPLGVGESEDFRISLAGNQEKTAFLKKDNQWLKPIGATATTHIFKPSMGILKSGLNMSLSVENEWLCLKLCEAFGFKVNKAEMGLFEDQKVLIIERFDRRFKGEYLIRLPQEDLCQALGYPSSRKYQNEGGPGINEIMELLKESDHSEEDRRTFFKSQVIYWLLAGIDGHAKNFSIFLQPGGFVLTPLYDVLSADAFVDEKVLRRNKIKMSMWIGNNKHYRVKDILGRHFRQMSSILKYSESTVNEILQEVVELTPKAINQVKEALPKNFPMEMAEKVFAGLEKRVKRI